jgi:hypothetical protein
LENPTGGVTSISSTFRNCYTGYYSGGIYIKNGDLIESDSTFPYLSGINGGVILLDKGSLHLTNSVF